MGDGAEDLSGYDPGESDGNNTSTMTVRKYIQNWYTIINLNESKITKYKRVGS